MHSVFRYALPGKLLVGLLLSGAVAHGQASAVAIRTPLTALKYAELPLGAVKPQGWLRQQLLTIDQGATGHLAEFFPKLRDDNGWLGGKGDNWEETPYWLDGALPLAHLLDDARLKAKMQRYIDWTLTTQRPSGYFGPLTKAEQAAGKPLNVEGEQGEDWWPRMVMLKVLKQHYQATQDPRVLPFMTKYFHYQLQNLPSFPLVKWSEWSRARNSRAVERGPLVYALHIPHTQTKGTIKEEGDYYEFKPAAPWNYGLQKSLIEKPEQYLTVIQKPLPSNQPGTIWNPERAPVELTAIGRRIPGWQLNGNVAPQPVTSRDEVYKGEVSPAAEKITLIPYGCTTLRVVAFPVVN
ncbi:hypothetical protein DNI29_13065 [Hymenobacter sediminis]|nr:hypothetical protein DNI29_13065 [Hymenobacter sediminis]